MITNFKRAELCGFVFDFELSFVNNLDELNIRDTKQKFLDFRFTHMCETFW